MIRSVPDIRALSIGLMNMRGLMRTPVTNHMNGVTGLTFLEMMIVSEQVPVGALAGHDYTRALAKRASAVERCDHCRSYEF